MLRTSVPKATINEDREMQPRENDVGPDADAGQLEPDVLTKSQPGVVER
ncbi:MAG: hypothetical protein QOJ29_3823 [Thermoleophilaceae bacterium]|jgi:hypothetical protein|nr:hypothetical protein [Thermoleophilaceae bacterium]